MSQSDSERTPLVSGQVVTGAGSAPVAEPAEPPPAYSAGPGNDDGGIAVVGANVESQRRITCEVCHASLTYADRPGLRVVTCSRCSEATPVGSPPPGKVYLRCVCNCLLTCTASARTVICPRPNCKRTVHMSTSASTDRITCPHCQITVPWTARGYAARRCRQCLNVMPVNQAMVSYARTRAALFLFIAMMLLALGVTAIVLIAIYGSAGIYAAPIACILLSVYFFARAWLYFQSVSHAPIQ